MFSVFNLTLITLYMLAAGAFPIEDTLNPAQGFALWKRCGAVGSFMQDLQASDWTANGLDDWLSTWWNNHTSDISTHRGGFAGAYGMWALGDPDRTCLVSDLNNCGTTAVCDSRVLNDKGDFIKQAYYVVEATARLHSNFIALKDSFEISAIGAALSKDEWATTFYKDKDDKSVTVLKEILNLVQTLVGIGAALLGGIEGVAIAGAAGSAIFGGAVGAASPTLGTHKDDTFQKSADLGGILGEVVVGSLKEFIKANDVLMHGCNYQHTGDIRTYLSGGAFLAAPPVDETQVIDRMNAFLIGNAVNQLYRNQKIFIMGGGMCGDGDGIGSGPQEAVLCRDNKAWYLYYWQENDAIASTTSHQWGWVNPPPGLDQLGNGDYSGVKVEDVISSSLDAYNAAGYNYTADTARDRAQSALRDQWRNPAAQGPSWEGTFTIPVCDVGWAINNDVERKEWILQPYGHDSRPNWCGPICSGDAQKTKDFIQAAKMDNFKSPKHMCETDVPY